MMLPGKGWPKPMGRATLADFPQCRAMQTRGKPAKPYPGSRRLVGGASFVSATKVHFKVWATGFDSDIDFDYGGVLNAAIDYLKVCPGQG